MEAGTDRELFEASRGGDGDAFAALVERYHALVCAVAYGVTGNPALAEDVAQDAFVAAWRGRTELQEPSRFRAWICAIARHLALNTRRERRHDELDDEVVAGDDVDLHARLEREQRDALVWEAVAAIPERYRVPLVLFYREDRSVAEVAARLGISTANALQRLHRGRRHLKQGIESLVEQTLANSKPRRDRVTAIVAALGTEPADPSSVGAALEAARAGDQTASWTVTIMKATMTTAAVVGLVAAIDWGCASWESGPRGTEAGVPESVDEATKSAAIARGVEAKRDDDPADARRMRETAASESADTPALPSYQLTNVGDDLVAVNLQGGASEVRQGSKGPARPMRKISGRVVDDSGAPLNGAVVIAGERLTMGLGTSVTARSGDETDARGRFELDVPADAPCSVLALHSGTGWSKIERLTAATTPARVELVTAPPVRIRGRASRGSVPQDGGIMAVAKDIGVLWYTPTDAAGSFEVLLPPGAFELGFIPGEDGLIGTPLVTKQIDERAGAQVTWDPELASGTRLAVDVPVPAAHADRLVILWVYVLPGRDVPKDVTTLKARVKADAGASSRMLGHGGDDLEEVFEFVDLAKGTYTVCAQAEAGPRESLAMTCKVVELTGKDDVEDVKLTW